jgi:hypothetical protein
MKKTVQLLLTFLCTLTLAFVLLGCNTTTSATTTTTTSGSETTTTTTTTEEEVAYYVGASWNNYLPNDPGSQMTPISGKDGWYTLTAELTAENRDSLYDGHYYKVTNGTWDAAGCWGAAEYALQPAPASPTGGGLGSVWVYDNQTLTILFDSSTHTVYDSSMVEVFETPIIYRDFSSWSLDPDAGAIVLTQSETDENIYTGSATLGAYTGEGYGWSFAVALDQMYYTSWYVWGVKTQYLFSGADGGFGKLSYIDLSAETTITFTYDAETHQTDASVDVIEPLATPVVYGTLTRKTADSECFLLEGEGALAMTASETAGLWEMDVELDTFVAPTEGWYTADLGYRVLVVTAKQYYAAWDSWGASSLYQYDLAGTLTGTATILTVTEDGTYHFVFDEATHVTTVSIPFPTPLIYGSFGGWSLVAPGAIVLTPNATDANLFEGSITLAAATDITFNVVLDKVFYPAWGVWGAGTQYVLSGTPAGFGQSTKITLAEESTLSFVYDATTHVTTVVGGTAVDTLASPVIYGDFSSWKMTAADGAVILTQSQSDSNLYVGTATLPVYAGTGTGWSFDVCTTLMSYGAYGWGAGTQYLFDGTVAGFGQSSYVDVEVSAVYTFTYNATTHVTTFTIG